MAKKSLPRRVRVAEILNGRYAPGKKPVSWDERKAGIEKIKTADGETLTLYSGGGQSTPAPGWELLLTKEQNDREGAPVVQWTLYGLR